VRLFPHKAFFRSSLSCDQDNDGIGEFGLFIEITGEQPCRGPAATLIKGPMINKIFGITSTVNQGIASKSGYLYLMHLPTITGPALTEEDYFIMPLPTPRSDPLSADVQEIRFMCYSWPSVAGITGNKAFCVSHATEVFFTLNELGPGVWRYSGALPANRPVSGAALNGTNPAFAMNLEAFFIPLNPALDGLVWFPLSQ
jgi:hypothetical protein